MTGFVTTSLTREHNRGEFHCGVDALDRYLRELAPQDVKRRVAGCFVALNDSDEILGFYTLAATSVPFGALPASLTKRLPPYPIIPAMLLGRLAVAFKHRGKEFGRALVADALIRTDSFEIGAFALIVDAKDTRAIGFYEAIGFALIPGETRRLFLPMATALQSFAPEKKSRE